MRERITLRPPLPSDTAMLVAARDEEFRRWLGPGSDTPEPSFCILSGEQVVGWVDYDRDADHDWLGDGEVNIGYFVFAEHRGHGYAAEAVELLLQHLSHETPYTTATLLIDPENKPSLAVARRCGFDLRTHIRTQHFLHPPGRLT
jgi:RimJ/RimL family protein N-acetyltransferase